MNIVVHHDCMEALESLYAGMELQGFTIEYESNWFKVKSMQSKLQCKSDDNNIHVHLEDFFLL